jgi:hypothetical protein
MKKTIFKTVVVCVLVLISITGGYKTAYAQALKTDFRLVNRSITLNKEPGMVHLNQADGAGIAWMNDKVFKSGIIEFDVKGKDEFQGSFVGIAFHGLNDSTYESVYFRPFNFRATDPVRKAHAVQYIANPNYDWPKLRADFPNKYEQPISPALDPNQWFHVKITVTDELVSVYVNEGTRPALEIKPLVNTGGTMIGYWVGNGSDGDWKNLKTTSK